MKPSVLVVVRHVVEECKRFLRTSYRFYGEHPKAQFEAHLQQRNVVVRSPYVTLTGDFQVGPTLVPHERRATWTGGASGS